MADENKSPVSYASFLKQMFWLQSIIYQQKRDDIDFCKQLQLLKIKLFSKSKNQDLPKFKEYLQLIITTRRGKGLETQFSKQLEQVQKQSSSNTAETNPNLLKLEQMLQMLTTTCKEKSEQVNYYKQFYKVQSDLLTDSKNPELIKLLQTTQMLILLSRLKCVEADYQRLLGLVKINLTSNPNNQKLIKLNETLLEIKIKIGDHLREQLEGFHSLLEKVSPPSSDNDQDHMDVVRIKIPETKFEPLLHCNQDDNETRITQKQKRWRVGDRCLAKYMGAFHEAVICVLLPNEQAKLTFIYTGHQDDLMTFDNFTRMNIPYSKLQHLQTTCSKQLKQIETEFSSDAKDQHVLDLKNILLMINTIIIDFQKIIQDHYLSVPWDGICITDSNSSPRVSGMDEGNDESSTFLSWKVIGQHCVIKCSEQFQEILIQSISSDGLVKTILLYRTTKDQLRAIENELPDNDREKKWRIGDRCFAKLNDKFHEAVIHRIYPNDQVTFVLLFTSTTNGLREIQSEKHCDVIFNNYEL